MSTTPTEQLRVLVADGESTRLAEVVDAAGALGHEVVVRETDLGQIGHLTAVEHPDVAFVVFSDGGAHALALIDRIVHEAACPVIAVLDVEDRDFVNEAAKRGVFAYITGEDLDRMQSAIDIVLRRFAEYHNLEAAFRRRAVTERAKGILMERHSIDEAEAFALLRDEARRSRRKVVDVAEAVTMTYSLMPARPPGDPPTPPAPPA